MNEKLKAALIYIVLPLIVGIVFAVTIYKLESFGKSNIHKSYVNSWINFGNDSLANHFPDAYLLNDAVFTTIAPQDKKEIGGGYVKITIKKNDSLDNFIRINKIENNITSIKKEQIFNADLNYEERLYELRNYTDSSLYPFPNFINHKNFDDYKIVFYDFGKEIFLPKNRLKENKHININWKHGYTRGIVENKNHEYEMWLIIW